MGKTSQDSFVHRSASSPLDGCRILVAEDESLIALDLERILEDFGCEVVGPLSIAFSAESESREIWGIP